MYACSRLVIDPLPALTTTTTTLFVPHTVPMWNTLSVLFVSNSYVPHFRSHVWMHIAH